MSEKHRARRNRNPAAGQDIHRLMTELFPICRSITGAGMRETLGI